jgi:surface protein
MRKVQKFWGLLFAVLSVLVVFQGKSIAQTPYGIFDEETGTLTLGYGETLPKGAVEVSEVVSDWKYIGENITSAQNVKKVVFDNSFACFKPTTCAYWFYGCLYLTEIQYIGNLKTDNVTNMRCMFSNCSSLTSLDLSNFKTDNVTDMSRMFSRCSSLTSLDVSNFKTDKVTNMYEMFNNCSNLKVIYVGDNWNTDAVTSSSYMFSYCNRLYGNKGSSVYDYEQYDKTYARIDEGEENPGYFTKIGELPFQNNAYAVLTDDILTFFYNKNRPENAYEIYEITQKSNITKVVFDESFKNYKPKNCNSWFYGCSKLTDIEGMTENLNTENVWNMSGMFENCSSLTSLDLSNFKTDNVTNMGCMFYNCRKLKTIYVGDNWNTDAVTSSYGMFDGCNRLYGSKGSSVYDYEKYDKTYARIDKGEENPGYFIKIGEQPFENNAYAVLTDDILTFFYNKNRPDNAYEISEITQKSNITKVVFDESFKNYKPTSCKNWFDDCSKLTDIEGMSENLNTENVWNMSGMFANCSSLTSLDLSNFKTDKVTNMNCMFYNCSNLSVIYVNENWSTQNTKYGSNMFYGTEKKLCGGKGTCSYDVYNDDIHYAKIDGGESAPGLFTKIGDEPFIIKQYPYGVIKGNVITLYYDENYEQNCNDSENDGTQLICNLRQWKIEKVVFDKSFANYRPKNTSNWFYDYRELTEIEGMKEYLNTEQVTNMSDMFYGCESLTSLDLSNFKTDNVTNMSGMFYDCNSLTNLDLSNFDTKNVTNMNAMFYNCNSLTNLDLSNFDTKNVTNMSGMFNDCYNLTSLDISNFNTENVENMDTMFASCKLTNLDLSNFKTDNVRSMKGMFASCSRLTNLDLSGFNTNNVTDMSYMFEYCISLTNLDLSGFNTKNVTNMKYLFFRCQSLKTIYAEDSWNNNALTSTYIFDFCGSLVGGKGTKYNSENISGVYARIDGGEENPGYFTEKAVISIKTFPTKTQYFEGEDIDLSGGEILLSYKISEDEVIDMTDENVSFSKNNNTIEIFYNGGKIGKFDITVKAVEPEKIELTALPEKVEYFVGEDFSAKGGALKITYNNGDTKIIDLTADGVKISGFDKNKATKQTLKVECLGKETTFEVLVKAKSAVSISITTSPKKTEYIKGEKLDVSEGEITVKYDSGEEKIVELSATKISGYDRNKVGKQTLTVEYQGLTTTFDVEVEQENIVPKPENPETKTDDIVIPENVKIWSSGKTIFVENGGKEIFIVDMSGKIVKTVKPDSNRIEIQMSKGGIYIVKTNSKTQKVIIR